MEKWSSKLVTREIDYVKMQYQHSSIKMAKVKKTGNTKSRQEYGGRNSPLADGCVNWYNHLEDCLTGSARADEGMPCGIYVPLLGMYPRKCLSFSHQKSYREILRAALFIIVPN